jgi:hypothetical protein
MANTSDPEKTVRKLLVSRLLVLFQTAGAPLTGERLEHVKILPTDYLHCLIAMVEKLESDDQDGHFKAVNDMVQIYWNDSIARAIVMRRVNGAMMK